MDLTPTRLARQRPAAWSRVLARMPMVVGGWLLVASWIRAAVAAEPAGALVTDTPWRSGLIYSVYDPHYGRLSPEVQRGRNARGKPLTLGGRSFTSGYGCRGFSIIELNVPEGIAAVTGIAGIDSENAGASGDTYFSVWIDGACRWRSPALNRSDPPVQFTVPVRGATVVKLITDAQAYGNADLADWVEPRWQPTAPDAARWQYLPATGAWYVRPELHAFHLAYRGEALPVTVIGDRPGPATLGYEIRGRSGGRLEVRLEASPQGGAQATVPISLAEVPNGLHELSLVVTVDGKHAAARNARFGLIDTHAGRPPSGTLYGVNHHEFVASYEALAAAGFEWSRQWFCWQWIEPERGQWHWNWHDERLAAARATGIRTIGVLGGIGQPAWSSPANVPEGYQTTHGCPSDMSAWDEYVRQVASRYRGQVQVWESWNEVTFMAEPGRHGWSVDTYVELQRRTHRVLKEIDPANKLLVCADRLQFVQRCLDAGLGDAFEGIAIHPYRPGSTPEQLCANSVVDKVGDVQSVFTDCRAWLRQHQRPEAEIWATEIGWALSGEGWVHVSPEEHGRYLARTLLLAQGSGEAANLCWHDFALGMFGVCDGQGFPRPAILSCAGAVSRLLGARPVRRETPERPLHTCRFRRQATDVLAVWSEGTDAFALLRPPAELRVSTFDWFGNPGELTLPAAGKAVPVTGRVLYLEGPDLAGVAITRADPITVVADPQEVIAGHSTALRWSVRNQFSQTPEFRLRTEAVPGLVPVAAETAVTVAWQEQGQAALPLAVPRAAVGGEHLVPTVAILPGGETAPFAVSLRILPPVTAEVDAFDWTRLGAAPVALLPAVTNRDDCPLSGRLVIKASDGFAVTPASFEFGNLAPGARSPFAATLVGMRQPAAGDRLELTVTSADGASTALTRSLSPTVLDRDRDGLADGWRLNAENTGTLAERNQAVATIETGDREFFCQRVHCQRFTSGWIILHRDRQDRITKGRRYRVTCRARQAGLSGTVGVGVFNLQPWLNCGIENHFRLGPQWQDVAQEFVATTDSDNVRFEFYFTETGTLWIEGMRLAEVAAR